MPRIPHKICYAIKANSNLAVLRVLRDLGAGADIVSGGEMRRALKAGFPPERIVFSGVGKTGAELEAAVEARLGHVNLESVAEMNELAEIAKARGARVRVGIRVNPDVTAKTHPFIATGQGAVKFGVPYDQVVDLAVAIAQQPSLELDTIAMHLGSQLLDPGPTGGASRRLLELVGSASPRRASTHCDISTSAAASASGTATKPRWTRRWSRRRWFRCFGVAS